ncbi:heat shock transcription factor-like isoform X2 [Aricia agestis]|uniref:heat shock transcription factor-like isoform X2 n=1 Tax=Aricia agestis TaxID=91739 RepID=UPI001C205C2A|nr:heat shock transcription factor-like isoform X2 [Aricia agestis]
MEDTNDTKVMVFQNMRFPQKLWQLLKLGSNAIMWGGSGQSILLNYKILHLYLQTHHSIFKTSNISSFIRQLNLYGFRKVTSHLQDPLCNSSNPFMHEYMHDYFQCGRPELLKKISRKPLNFKTTSKFKKCNMQGQTSLTPLQKARHSLRVALNKAVENYYLHNYEDNKCKIEFEDAQEVVSDNGEVDINMFMPKENEVNPKTDSMKIKLENEYSWFNNSRDCQQNPNEGVQMQLVEANSCYDTAKMELLAEFNVNKNTSLLNCILPSLGNDNIDDNAVNENTENYFHGEWEQMLNDINANKHSFYSQISMANDILNPENFY